MMPLQLPPLIQVAASYQNQMFSECSSPPPLVDKQGLFLNSLTSTRIIALISGAANNLRNQSTNGARRCSCSISRTCLVTIIFLVLIGVTVSSPVRSFISNSNNNSIKNSSGDSPSQKIPVSESGSSLSIMSPLDVLRQNMVIEILRRKHRQSKQRQLQLNKEILDRIG